MGTRTVNIVSVSYHCTSMKCSTLIDPNLDYLGIMACSQDIVVM